MRIQERVSRVENKVDVLATKVDALASKVDDFIEEMRDKDRQRAEEILALRAEMISRDDKLAAAVDSMGKHVRNITIAAMVGIGALALSGGAIAVAVIYSVLSKQLKGGERR